MEESAPLKTGSDASQAASQRKARILTVLLVIAVLALAAIAAGIIYVAVTRDSDDDTPSRSSDGQHIKAHVRFVSDPITEGRGTGTHGEWVAAKYVAQQLESYGVAPAGDSGTFYQSVPIRRVSPSSSEPLLFTDANGTVAANLTWYTDYVASTQGNDSEVSIQNEEIVFVGYGIYQKSMGWNDYKTVDIKGKVVLALLGQPESGKWNGTYFTWNARWNGKLDEAASRGAKAIIFVNLYSKSHSTWSGMQETAGSDVVQLPSKLPATPVSVYAFMPSTLANTLAVACGAASVNDWYSAAESANFTPYTLPLNASLAIKFSFANFSGTQVVGIEKGVYWNETVVVSAHLDSLGTDVDGSIYAGAMDNAVGTGIVLEIARVIAANRLSLNRSVMYTFTTAEAEGILGAWYFVQQYQSKYKLLGDINFWTGNTWGLTTDVYIIGMSNSTLGTDIMRKACKLTQLDCVEDTEQEEYGYFLYGDNFAFHHEGVPAVWVQQGWDYVGHSEDDFWLWVDDQLWACYHDPCDVFNESWVFNGTAQMADVGIEAALLLATSNYVPSLL